jgi:membrane-bound lytic murein transglycosylase A
MEKIRNWLAAHPARAQKIMNENPSYVFFREIKGEGPVGAQGVALTPLRSLAVDPSFVPLGTMLWLATEKQNRLVVAQDTGGAIKGAVRGDLFWGHGSEAARCAGEMQEQGTYYLLFPKKAE